MLLLGLCVFVAYGQHLVNECLNLDLSLEDVCWITFMMDIGNGLPRIVFAVVPCRVILKDRMRQTACCQ